MKRLLVLFALLGAGFAFSWWGGGSDHAGRGDTEAVRVAEPGSKGSFGGPGSGGRDRIVEDASSGSGQGRASLSNAATDSNDGMSLGPTGIVPNPREIEVETRPSGLKLKAVFATSPEFAPKVLSPSQQIASLGVVFTGWAPEFTGLVGVTHDGRVSGAVVVDFTPEERPRVVLDFDAGRLVSGVVFDSLSADLLSDVRATLRSVEGFELSSTDESSPAEPPALETLCHSDANGVLEFRLPMNVAVEVALEKRGYATQLIRIEPTASTRTDFGQVALEPVDRLEVRLNGFDPSCYQSYRVGFSNDAQEHEIDVSGVAFIECSKAIVDARVVVRTPSGGVLTTTLSGAPRDHSPLTIDLTRPTTLRVRWNGGPRWSSHDLWAAVTMTSDAATTSVMTARLIDGEALIDVPFVGAATVGLLDFAKSDSSSWIAMTEVTFGGQSRLTVELEEAWADHGVRLLDLGGQPIRSQAVSVDLVDHGWNGVCVTDETGWVSLPGPSGRAFRLSGRLEDGRIFVDLPATASSRGDGAIDLMLGAPQVYDVQLVDRGQPCSWELLVIKGGGPWSTVWSEFTLDDGTLGEFQVLGDGRPVCRIAGPNLLESTRDFNLQPGLNVLEVRRTAALEVVVPSGVGLETASLRRPAGGGDVAAAIDAGRVVEAESRSDQYGQWAGTVRWDALPLGTYEWRAGEGSWATVTLSRPGSVVKVEAR